MAPDACTHRTVQYIDFSTVAAGPARLAFRCSVCTDARWLAHMNGRPAHEPRISPFAPFPGSCCRLLLVLPAWPAGLRMQQGGPPCKDGGATRGRTGVKARGGLRWVICDAMRFVVACESRLTHTHTHPPTHTGTGTEGTHAPHGGRFIHAAPLPPPCDPALQAAVHILVHILLYI